MAEVIPHLPGDLDAAVFVVQHMPPGFTRSLANRLDGMSHLRVTEAQEGERSRSITSTSRPAGCTCASCPIVRAPGASRSTTRSRSTASAHRPIGCSSPSPSSSDGRASAWCSPAWGKDGSEGLKEMRAKGGIGIVQDRATSTIYGMPQAALLRAGAEHVSALTDVRQRSCRARHRRNWRRMIEQHWKLSRRAFANTPDPAFVYRSPAFAEGFARLLYDATDCAADSR